MTADVVQMHPEAAAIVSASTKRAQVERQQALGSLIAAIGDGRLSITDDQDLPLIVDVLLRNCPQIRTSPVTVAKSVEEAADAHRAAASNRSEIDYTGDVVFIVAALAAGTAHTATYTYMLEGCQQLADWLVAAAVSR